MPRVHIFDVKPKIHKRLEALIDLAYNFHWCWNHQTIDLFQRLEPDLWDEVDHNPVKLLGRVSQERYLEVLEDDGFLDHLESSLLTLQTYLMEKNWFQKEYPGRGSMRIGYFSAEIGLHECIPMYSGGLGVLAGDHLKSSSDLGIAIVGVGLAYQKGYVQQYLNADGWQQETYKVNNFVNMPLKLVRDAEGQPVVVKIRFPHRDLAVQCWKAEAGRVPLYLLDTNLEGNSPSDRTITDELYGGDLEKRIQQEIVLGIGGYRMLKALNETPTVFHMNEGHSAFLAVERIRDLMQEHGLSCSEATEAAIAGNIFTTHTPVPAGNDIFPQHLIEKYFRHYYESCGMNLNDFMNLGRTVLDDGQEGFCMTILAMKLSSRVNAVSRLHRNVSRRMWKSLWPGLPSNELPIVYIGNGVHPASWISREMYSLLTRYLGPQWDEAPHGSELWKRVDKISDEELWRTHERGRERLVAFARQRLKQQLRNRGASAIEILSAEDVLNPEYLTIGFGRRFATYKRATLLFQNPARLKKIIAHSNRPVQFIFAGKAHPKDEPGKEFIRKIVHFSRDPEVRYRLVFIENYDLCVARHLVQGADVWLNTPRRELEASGTSGMKVAFNGGLNLSVLDGWWDEGFHPNLGWAIGKGEVYKDYELQDEIESNALYDLLEQEIIPLFYKISANGIPREWVKYIKESMKALCPAYSTNRMSGEYTTRFYLPADEDFVRMAKDDFRLAKEVAKWKEKIRQGWSELRVVEVSEDAGNGFKVDDYYQVTVKAQLGALSPDDVSAELYYGEVDENCEVMEGEAIALDYLDLQEDGLAVFSGKIPLKHSGRFGFSARLRPNHRKLLTTHEPGFITWEK